MLDGFRHWLSMGRLQRGKRKASRLFENRIRSATKRGYETHKASALRQEWQAEMRYLDDGMDIAESQRLMLQASRYRIPVPDDDDVWEESLDYQTRFLSREGASKVRAAVRAEQKARWDYWQARLSMIGSIIGIVGGIMGAVAYFKPPVPPHP